MCSHDLYNIGQNGRQYTNFIRLQSYCLMVSEFPNMSTNYHFIDFILPWVYFSWPELFPRAYKYNIICIKFLIALLLYIYLLRV